MMLFGGFQTHLVLLSLLSTALAGDYDYHDDYDYHKPSSSACSPYFVYQTSASTRTTRVTAPASTVTITIGGRTLSKRFIAGRSISSASPEAKPITPAAIPLYTPPSPTPEYTPLAPKSTPGYTPLPPKSTPEYTPLPPKYTPEYKPLPAKYTPEYTPLPPKYTPEYTPLPPKYTPEYTPLPPKSTPECTTTPLPPKSIPKYTPLPPKPTPEYTPLPPKPTPSTTTCPNITSTVAVTATLTIVDPGPLITVTELFSRSAVATQAPPPISVDDLIPTPPPGSTTFALDLVPVPIVSVALPTAPGNPPAVPNIIPPSTPTIIASAAPFQPLISQPNVVVPNVPTPVDFNPTPGPPPDIAPPDFGPPQQQNTPVPSPPPASPAPPANDTPAPTPAPGPNPTPAPAPGTTFAIVPSGTVSAPLATFTGGASRDMACSVILGGLAGLLLTWI